jgi:hypothetical protein
MVPAAARFPRLRIAAALMLLRMTPAYYALDTTVTTTVEIITTEHAICGGSCNRGFDDAACDGKCLHYAYMGDTTYDACRSKALLMGSTCFDFTARVTKRPDQRCRICPADTVSTPLMPSKWGYQANQPQGGGAGPRPGWLGSSSSSQWGWSFLALMGAVVGLYGGLGYLHGWHVRGRRGTSAMPHAELWAELPGLVADGVVFSGRWVVSTTRAARYTALGDAQVQVQDRSPRPPSAHTVIGGGSSGQGRDGVAQDRAGKPSRRSHRRRHNEGISRGVSRGRSRNHSRRGGGGSGGGGGGGGGGGVVAVDAACHGGSDGHHRIDIELPPMVSPAERARLRQWVVAVTKMPDGAPAPAQAVDSLVAFFVGEGWTLDTLLSMSELEVGQTAMGQQLWEDMWRASPLLAQHRAELEDAILHHGTARAAAAAAAGPSA